MPAKYQAYEAKVLELKTLFVKNLPPKFNADELAAVFDDYGLVKRCQVKFTKEREFHNYGSVEICAKGAERAIKALKTTMIRGNILGLEIVQQEKKYNSFSTKAYSQMDNVPETKEKWRAQAERWENTYRPKNTGPTASLKGLAYPKWKNLKDKKPQIQSTIVERNK
jgi:RNA recognition motif-containing protein